MRRVRRRRRVRLCEDAVRRRRGQGVYQLAKAVVRLNFIVNLLLFHPNTLFLLGEGDINEFAVEERKDERFIPVLPEYVRKHSFAGSRRWSPACTWASSRGSCWRGSLRRGYCLKFDTIFFCYCFEKASPFTSLENMLSL